MLLALACPEEVRPNPQPTRLGVFSYVLRLCDKENPWPCEPGVSVLEERALRSSRSGEGQMTLGNFCNEHSAIFERQLVLRNTTQGNFNEVVSLAAECASFDLNHGVTVDFSEEQFQRVVIS